MNIPEKLEFVEVVNNETMEVMKSGYLLEYMPRRITIGEETLINGTNVGYMPKYYFDARYVHFKGYKPKELKIK